MWRAARDAAARSPSRAPEMSAFSNAARACAKVERARAKRKLGPSSKVSPGAVHACLEASYAEGPWESACGLTRREAAGCTHIDLLWMTAVFVACCNSAHPMEPRGDSARAQSSNTRYCTVDLQ